jgi:hypothetical protein
MKSITSLLLALVALAMASGVAGCATSKQQQGVQQKEDLLQAAGFKLIPATTPEQQQMLKTLPNTRVSAVRRKGQVYFVFPARSQAALYVGQNAQYVAYQQAGQIPTEDALVKQEIQSINRSMSSPGWEAPWGDWDTQ